MTIWHTPLVGGSRLDDLIARYTRLMVPKKGNCQRAYAEVQRQRLERLEQIERLRQEAAALFVIERQLMQRNIECRSSSRK